jgi:protein SCO1/2
MRRSTVFCATIALAAVAAALFAAGCGRNGSDHRQYQLHGQVLSLTPDRKEATIKHDEIPGFMPAMTMPYKVQDPALFDGVAPGDIIDAILVVVPDDAYLSAVHKRGSEPLPADVVPPMAARSGVAMIPDGAAVPNATFLNQDGERVDLRSFDRAALVVTFTYTRCPMPTMCPLMDRNFQALQEKLKARRGLNARLLSVTLDPTFDRPDVLKKHAEELGADPALWSFLTSEDDKPGAIDAFASEFGLSITRNPENPTDITHTLRTLLIDRQGNLVKGYMGNEWTPDEVLGDLVVLVGVD